MAFDILSSLELDKDSLRGKLIVVKELSGCEGDFIFGCLISKQIKERGAVCLVAVHHDFNHHRRAGLKLGHCLEKLKNSGDVSSVDYLKIHSDSIDRSDSDSSLDSLFKSIEKDVSAQSKTHDSVLIIVDDLTHFLDLQFTVKDINIFIQKCKKLLITNENCSLVIGVHVISETDESYLISNLISHMSDIICEVAPLQTGRSSDVSGSLNISRPWTDGDCINENRLTKIDRYLFKTFDRGIKVFAPGSSSSRILFLTCGGRNMARPQDYTVEQIREILLEITESIAEPDNYTKLSAAKEVAGNEMLRMMQFVYPCIVQIEYDVIKKYGFTPAREGMTHFIQIVKEMERVDPEIARLYGEIRNHFLPPVSITKQFVNSKLL